MEQLDGSSLIHILTHISGNKISSGRLRKNYGLELSEAQILRYRNKEQSGFPAGVTPKNFADTITKINEECYLGTADELIQRITEIIEEDLKAPGISSHLKESYCDVKGKKGEKEALSVFLKKLHAFCNGRKPFSKKPKVPPKVFSIIILASTGDLQEDIDGISSFITRDLGVPYKNINPNFSFRIIVNPSINEIQGYNDDTLYCVFVNECVETDLLDLYNSLVTQKEASDMRNIIAFIKKPASGEGRHESVEKFQDQYYNDIGQAPFKYNHVAQTAIFILRFLNRFLPEKVKISLNKDGSMIEVDGNAVLHTENVFGEYHLKIVAEKENQVKLAEQKYAEASEVYTQKPTTANKKKMASSYRNLEKEQQELKRLKQDMVKGIFTTFEKIQGPLTLDFREKEAVNCIEQESDYEKAFSILRDKGWKEEIQLEMEVAGKATEKAKESLKGYISGQRFLITQLRARGYSDDIANEITEIYDDVVSLAKKHAVALDVLYEYADFLRVFRRYEEGLIIALKLERCRDYYGHIDGVDSSELYLLIGQLYYGLADFDSALKYYERSLKEKKAATVVDSEMITKVALEIAALSWKRGEFEKAKQALDKLVSDLQQQEKDASTHLREMLADAYNRTAVLANKMWLLDEAENYHLEALRIMEDIKEQAKEQAAKDLILPKLSRSYSNLGIVYRKMRKHEEAEECYKKACDIREEGHQRVRGLFGKGLALTYGNYAYLLGEMKKTDQAKKLIEKSIKIKEQDASKAIPASMHTLAMSWDNYGMILYYSADESKEQEAGQWFEKAIRQKKELVSKDYLTYAPSLAQSYFHYARLLSKDKEKMQLAKSCLEKAIEIQEAREKDNQGYLTQDLAESYHVLAVVLQEINPGDAEKAYKYAKKHGGILFKRCAYYKSEYVSILEDYSSFLKQQSDNSATYEEIIAEITEVKGED